MKPEIIEILEKYNQKHLMKWIDGNEEMENQLLNLDIEKIMDLYQNTKEKIRLESNIIEHIPYIDKAKLEKSTKEEFQKIGEMVIENGNYAVVTMAGGQGTRLGHNGPKGTYLLNTVNGPKYLFEIIIESLKKAKQDYGVYLPWYVMTSEENNEQTVNFLKEHQFFGYPSNKVKFFKQGKLPLISEQGKLFIDKTRLIKEASDGNGSIYASMKKEGILDDMKQNNIKWIFIGGVDNILLNMVDPVLIGATIEEGRKIASKTVVKREAHEKVGVFCKINGKPKIIEYTELPKEMAEETDENGELIYGDTNIISHLYNIEALEKMSYMKLPYHTAHKKAEYLDEKESLVKPEKPNAYKFESFIFDAFEAFDDMTILRVKRENEFAPIKNKEGNDSPETAVKLYNEFFKACKN